MKNASRGGRRGSRKSGIPDEVKAQRKEKQYNLLPKTPNQKLYLDALQAGVKLVVATGHAGTGKTFIAAAHAAQEFMKGHVSKIIIARPNKAMGQDGGHLPGTEFEKLYPYVRNMLDVLKRVLGDGKFQYMVEHDQIEVQPIEKIRGRSFDEKCVVIIDETQNTSPDQIKSIVTRIGEGCQMVLCGDPVQTDIRGESGLSYITAVIARHNISDTFVVSFTDNDIVRSGMVREFILAFEKDRG